MVMATVVTACPESAHITTVDDDAAMATTPDPNVWSCSTDPAPASLDGGSALQLSVFRRVVSARTLATTVAENDVLGQPATEPPI